MADHDDRDVSPDETLLQQIFGHAQPQKTTVILQTWEKCVFRADFSNGLDGNSDGSSVFVRVESAGNTARSKTKPSAPPLSFSAVAAMQDIARTCLADLVPKTLKMGETEDALVADAKGRKYQFSVVEAVDGDTLEDVWDGMTIANQRAVVADIVRAMKRLQGVRLRDEAVQSILRKHGHAAPGGSETAMGGPATGYLEDGRALLTALGEKWSLENHTVSTTEAGEDADAAAFLVRSVIDDIAPVAVSEAVLQQWPAEAVLCHNDVSPRNLILQKTDGSPWYALVGIIDWEMAGFYPPAFELGLQDTYLGTSNHHVSFYLLLRDELAAQAVVQRTPSQKTLLDVVSLVSTSQHRVLYSRSNIPAHIRQRFRDRLRLARHPDPFVGWAAYPTMTKAEMDALEDEVIADIRG